MHHDVDGFMWMNEAAMTGAKKTGTREHHIVIAWIFARLSRAVAEKHSQKCQKKSHAIGAETASSRGKRRPAWLHRQEWKAKTPSGLGGRVLREGSARPGPRPAHGWAGGVRGAALSWHFLSLSLPSKSIENLHVLEVCVFKSG